MSGGWGCPHETQGQCRRRGDETCDPGADGCVLEEGLRRAARALQPTVLVPRLPGGAANQRDATP